MTDSVARTTADSAEAVSEVRSTSQGGHSEVVAASEAVADIHGNISVDPGDKLYNPTRLRQRGTMTTRRQQDAKAAETLYATQHGRHRGGEQRPQVKWYHNIQ